MSRDRLRRFVETVRAGKAPDADALRFCADAFEAILAGDDADRALGLARPRGRPHKTTETVGQVRGGQRDQIAAVVEVLDEYDRLGRYDHAEARVAPRYAISPRQLQRWRRKYAKFAEVERRGRALRAEVEAACNTLAAAGREIPDDATVPDVIKAARQVRRNDK